MEIYSKEFYKIFEKNFGYKIVNTPLGKAIKMPARDAFIYSFVTGAGYLDNPIYQFSPKGLMKLFYNAFNYKFVTGIFDNATLKNTPYLFSRVKPFLFCGDKFIIPFEVDSEAEFQSFISEKFKTLENPENYIIQKIEVSKKGNGMEPFMEYITAEYFKNNGYIVENQIPLAHSIGSPDFGGYRIERFLNILNINGLFGGGFHIIELSLIRLNYGKSSAGNSMSNSVIVGEAKTSTRQMQSQLEKYLNTDLFSEGYEIHPEKDNPCKEYFGLVTFNQDFSVKVLSPKEKFVADNKLNKDEYVKWLTNYFKYYLVANFTNDELIDFSKDVMGSQFNTREELIDFINHLDINLLIKKVLSL
jgi:hypothetical protein